MRRDGPPEIVRPVRDHPAPREQLHSHPLTLRARGYSPEFLLRLPSTFDHTNGPQTDHFFGYACIMANIDDVFHVFVRPRRFLQRGGSSLPHHHNTPLVT